MDGTRDGRWCTGHRPTPRRRRSRRTFIVLGRRRKRHTARWISRVLRPLTGTAGTVNGSSAMGSRLPLCCLAPVCGFYFGQSNAPYGGRVGPDSSLPCSSVRSPSWFAAGIYTAEGATSWGCQCQSVSHKIYRVGVEGDGRFVASDFVPSSGVTSKSATPRPTRATTPLCTRDCPVMSVPVPTTVTCSRSSPLPLSRKRLA
jgi:hypothetical protein